MISLSKQVVARNSRRVDLEMFWPGAVKYTSTYVGAVEDNNYLRGNCGAAL
jgi:hypothetical protein